MTKHSNTIPQDRPTTKLGEAMEHLRDHRVSADQPARLDFCPSLKGGKEVRIHTVR